MNADTPQPTPGAQPAEDELGSDPYNPYEDGPAAKLWELLRRNKRFRQVARRIVKLASVPIPPTPTGGNATPASAPAPAAVAFLKATRRRCKADTAINLIKQNNSFAAAALRWLCPDPTFRLIIPKCVDGTTSDGQPRKWDLVWMGTQPNPPPITVPPSETTKHRPTLDGQPLHPDWQVGDEEPMNVPGPFRFGPRITQVQGDKPDLFHVWRQDQKTLPTFSIDLPWPQTPNLFRWHFEWLWRHIEHGTDQFSIRVGGGRGISHGAQQVEHGIEQGTVQFTGRPDPLLSAFETDFFQGWNLRDYDPYTVEHLTRILKFQRLSRCLVFAIPKVRSNGAEIDHMLKQIGGHLKAALVDQGDVLGSNNEWQVLLSVEQFEEQEGKDFGRDLLSEEDEDLLALALERAGERLYSTKYECLPDGSYRIKPKGSGGFDSQRHTSHLRNYYKAMRGSTSNDGWIRRLFPRLPLEILRHLDPATTSATRVTSAPPGSP